MMDLQDATKGEIYAVSRALFRRLAPFVASAGGQRELQRHRQRVLDACEMTMRRIASEPDLAHPARYLFGEIRTCFPLQDQLWVRRMVELHAGYARKLVDAAPLPAARQCVATNRFGAPCRREAVGASEYCPSHRHLEVLDERE
jgi:hypothetical protein